MNLALLELAETGELAKLEKKWWYDKGECLVDGANPSVINVFLIFTSFPCRNSEEPASLANLNRFRRL